MMSSTRTQYISASAPLVAIDLGSSGVRALAAVRTEDGYFRVLGYEESNFYPDYMDRGAIDRAHTSDAGFMISKVLNLLANRIGEKELPTAFQAIGGRSMQITQVQASRRLGTIPREVTQSLLDELERECHAKIEAHNEGVGSLALVPCYFELDKVRQNNRPTSRQLCREIEAHYTAFVTHRDVSDAMKKCFSQAGAHVVEASFARPEALLSAFIAVDGVEVLDAGCAVLDLGAQTSTLTICKGADYLATKTIAQGSDHITRFIEQQGMSYQLAEQLKTQYGKAMPRLVRQNCKMRIPMRPEYGKEVLTLYSVDLAQLIDTKLSEILGPLVDIINAYSSRIRRVYITGGGAMQDGILDWLQDRCRVEVMYGAHNRLLTRDTDDEYCSPRYASLIGTILMGADWREKHQYEAGFKYRVVNMLSQVAVTLFDGIED